MVCKCAIGLSSIEYLGFCVKDGKLTMGEENVNTTVEAQTRDKETGLNVFRYHWILQEIHILFCRNSSAAYRSDEERVSK